MSHIRDNINSLSIPTYLKQLLIEMGIQDHTIYWIKQNSYTTLTDIWKNTNDYNLLMSIVVQLAVLQEEISFDDQEMRQYCLTCIKTLPVTRTSVYFDLFRDDRSKKAVYVAEKYMKGKNSTHTLQKAHDEATSVVQELDAKPADIRAHRNPLVRYAAQVACCVSNQYAISSLLCDFGLPHSQHLARLLKHHISIIPIIEWDTKHTI